MAEEQDGQEKTEDASSRKKDKAREEGQAARSRELNTMGIVLAGAIGVWFIVPWSADIVTNMTRTLFERASMPDAGLFEALGLGLEGLLWATVPFGILMMVVGIGTSMAIGGIVIAPGNLSFKGERLSLMKGLGRMFSVKSLVELVKSIAKFGLVTGVSIGVIWTMLDDLLALSTLPLETAMVEGAHMVGLALFLIGSSLAVVAAIDVPWVIFDHNKQLRMTKQEVRDEMKDTEGKPEVRARIRQLQQEISRRRMLADVPTADVIITNPDHFSVAVKYDSANMGAPTVIAKGVDEFAMRIREVGRTSNVAQVQSPPLARALFYSVKVGGEVPQGLYIAVAQVLAYVYQLKSYRAGAQPDVPVYREAPIPAEFRTEANLS